MVAGTPYILVVNPALPYAGSLKDFIAAAKAQPGKLTIGSAGSGSGTHMTGELFRLSAGIKMTHVPYKSIGPAMSDVVAGQINSAISSVPVTLPLVKAGRLKFLAVAAPKRISLIPDVPTFGESGVSDVNVSNWYSVMSVGGTPKPVINRLYDEIKRAVDSPDMRERLAASALEPGPTRPSSSARWSRTNCSDGPASSRTRAYARNSRARQIPVPALNFSGAHRLAQSLYHIAPRAIFAPDCVCTTDKDKEPSRCKKYCNT